VAYRSQAGRFVEQHQWDAPRFTDPLPIMQWGHRLLLLHPAMSGRKPVNNRLAVISLNQRGALIIILLWMQQSNFQRLAT